MILLAAVVYVSNTALQVTQFTAVFADLPEGFDGARIAVLSDLHGAEFGENNTELFAAVAAEEPDYIFVAGDLIDEETPDALPYAAETAAGLAEIAPVYYVTGNHEWAAGDVPTLKKTLSAAGCTVLSNQYVALERNGDTAVLAGIDDPNGFADQKTPEALAAELYAAEGDVFWMLLAHRNNLFAQQYSLLGSDLVLSGHGHGGIWRLPFTDGLVSHDYQLFPSYTAGFYEENGSLLFASRGLGNSGPSFRVGNRPEIAVLTLHTKIG
jgi:predicted MPP superfamily phosphohydrolase